MGKNSANETIALAGNTLKLPPGATLFFLSPLLPRPPPGATLFFSGLPKPSYGRSQLPGVTDEIEEARIRSGWHQEREWEKLKRGWHQEGAFRRCDRKQIKYCSIILLIPSSVSLTLE